MAIFIDADTFTTDKVLELIALEGYDTTRIRKSDRNENLLTVPVGMGKVAQIEIGEQHVHFLVEDANVDYTFTYAVHNTAIFGRGLRKWVEDVRDLGVTIERLEDDTAFNF